MERFVSDRFSKLSESSLNTFIGAEIATEPRIGKWSFQIKRERCKLYDGLGFRSRWERLLTIYAPQQNINSCSHCTGATFETEQKPIQYSVNIASVFCKADSVPYVYNTGCPKKFAIFWGTVHSSFAV